jgi:hypothetical protein
MSCKINSLYFLWAAGQSAKNLGAKITIAI